jgi:hypothetical protein
MARSELSTIVSAAKRLRKKMKGEGNIKAWVQSKITKAADYLDSAADYVDSGEMKTEAVNEEYSNWRKELFQQENYKMPNASKRGAYSGGGPKAYKVGDEIPSSAMKPTKPSSKPPIYTTNKSSLPNYSGVFKKPLKVDEIPFNEDWQKVNRKDRTDGLSQKAVDAYRRENPGSKLQTAVTEKKPKGKRAKRRANFCRRMSGMKSKLTSAKTARDPDSRINKALRRWNCN